MHKKCPHLGKYVYFQRRYSTVLMPSSLPSMHKVYDSPNGLWETIYVNYPAFGSGATSYPVTDNTGQVKWQPTLAIQDRSTRTSLGRMGRSDGSDNYARTSKSESSKSQQYSAMTTIAWPYGRIEGDSSSQSNGKRNRVGFEFKSRAHVKLPDAARQSASTQQKQSRQHIWKLPNGICNTIMYSLLAGFAQH